MSICIENMAIGHDTIILSKLNFELPHNGFISLIGRNGAGKSTLLSTLAGNLKPKAGACTVAGFDLATLPTKERAKKISYLPSRQQSTGYMTLRDFVALGRTPHLGFSSRMSSRDWEIVDNAIQELGLSALTNRVLDETSDGERQRAGIAQALAQGTSIMLLDEPTAFVDVAARVEIVKMLSKLGQERLIVYSTHDVSLAGQLSSQMLLLDSQGVSLDKPVNLLKSGQLNSVFDSSIVNIESPDFALVVK